jgi:hypothetical protein
MYTLKRRTLKRHTLKRHTLERHTLKRRSLLKRRTSIKRSTSIMWKVGLSHSSYHILIHFITWAKFIHLLSVTSKSSTSSLIIQLNCTTSVSWYLSNPSQSSVSSWSARLLETHLLSLVLIHFNTVPSASYIWRLLHLCQTHLQCSSPSSSTSTCNTGLQEDTPHPLDQGASLHVSSIVIIISSDDRHRDSTPSTCPARVREPAFAFGQICRHTHTDTNTHIYTHTHTHTDTHT